MTTIHDGAQIASPQTTQQRIELRTPGDSMTFVDGGWWPESLDLTAELPALLRAVEAAGYSEVRRVSYALTTWDAAVPRKTAMLNRVVKLGGFRSQEPAELTLVDGSGRGRVTILVVPPDTDAAVALRALALAGTNGDQHRPREILKVAGQAHRTGCVDELAAAEWGSEGGRSGDAGTAT